MLETQSRHLQRVRDEGNTETCWRNINECETDAIDGHRTLGDHLASQLRRAVEPHGLPLLLFFTPGDAGYSVHMPLDDVAAESIADGQGTLEIDSISRSQLAEVGATKRFRDDLKCEAWIGPPDDGETCAVYGHAITEGELGGETGLDDLKQSSRAIGLDGTDGSQGFYQSGEHELKPSTCWASN